MVPDRQKVWTDGMDGLTDEAKTISLRLRRGIIIPQHLPFSLSLTFSVLSGAEVTINGSLGRHFIPVTAVV